MCSVIYYARYLNWGIRSHMAIGWLCTCSLTHDVSSLEDDNVFVFCVAFFLVFVFYIVEIEVSINIFLYFMTMYLYSRICIVYSSTNPWYIVLILQCRVFTKFLNLNTKRQLKPFYIFLEFPFWCEFCEYTTLQYKYNIPRICRTIYYTNP
jgi:hypothetical protein